MHKEGYVQWVGGNKYKGRNLFSFTIKGTDGFFSCGTDDPRLAKNDRIEFDYDERNGTFVVDTSSIKKVDLRSEPVGGGASPSYRAGGASGRDNDKGGYWDAKAERDLENDRYRRENDLRIQAQSARNAAIQWIGILVSQGALKIPEKNKKEVLDGALTDYTEFFYDQIGKIGFSEESTELEGVESSGN